MITYEQANLLPMPDSSRQLEFDLKLKNSEFQSTDGYLLDHDDQVRVRIQGLTLDMQKRNIDTSKIFMEREKNYKPNSKFKKYGLTCYHSVVNNYLDCYGKSKKNDTGGVILNINTLDKKLASENKIKQIRGESYEPDKYGGISVQWETNLDNWEKWQEIDSAIWRLLDAWNVSPLQKK